MRGRQAEGKTDPCRDADCLRVTPFEQGKKGMQEELAAYHRLLVIAYRRYLDADLVLALATNDMRTFFPADRMTYRGTIGAPGSRVRRLHEERDRALLRLQSSYEKSRAAKARVEQRQSSRTETLFLTLRIE